MINRLIIISLFFICCNIVVYTQINSNLFGFCTSNSFTYVNTNDTSFLSKVDSLSPKVLRFPGGTIGNFYHPKGKLMDLELQMLKSIIKEGFQVEYIL